MPAYAVKGQLNIERGFDDQWILFANEELDVEVVAPDPESAKIIATWCVKGDWKKEAFKRRVYWVAEPSVLEIDGEHEGSE